MSLAGATQDEVRRHNLAALVRFLHEHGKRVLPVNPSCVGAAAGLDAPVVASLAI